MWRGEKPKRIGEVSGQVKKRGSEVRSSHLCARSEFSGRSPCRFSTRSLRSDRSVLSSHPPCAGTSKLRTEPGIGWNPASSSEEGGRL